MQTKILSLVVALCGLAACQTLPPEMNDTERAQLEAAASEWVEAYNTTEMETFVSVFTNDAILMPPNGSAVVGRDQIAEWKASHEAGLRLAAEVEEINGSGDTAYTQGRYCLFMLKADDSFEVDPGKFVAIRKLQPDGSWLVDTEIFNSDLPAGAELQDRCPFADGWQ